MADNTHIEWTDATWTPITGCGVTSPGCTNCYAMKLAGTRLQHHPSRAGLTAPSKAGPVWTGEVRLNEGWLDQPLRWKRPRRIFVCAHGDLFHESVPDAWIDRVFAVMALAPQHTFQVLTKRSRRMREYMTLLDDRGKHHAMALAALMSATGRWDTPALNLINGWPLQNVWLGVSVEDQTRADARIPDLLATPAAVRWISAEPLLGAIALDKIHQNRRGYGAPPYRNSRLDWVVAGGESGPSARPTHPDWVRSLRDQCAKAGVPFLFKQWGEWCPRDQWEHNPELVLPDDSYVASGSAPATKYLDTAVVHRIGKAHTGRLLDGVLHDEYPVGGHND